MLRGCQIRRRPLVVDETGATVVRQKLTTAAAQYYGRAMKERHGARDIQTVVRVL